MSVPLSRLCLLTLISVTMCADLLAQTGRIRSGAAPGTQRWIVLLGGRTFSLRDRLAAIRAEPDATRRNTLMLSLATSSRADQDAFAQFAASVGTRFAHSFWTLNACVVEGTPAQIELLRSYQQAVKFFPDEERGPGVICASINPAACLPVPGASPAHNGTDDLNHNVFGPTGAHSILGHKGHSLAPGGQRAHVAVFDSGVDLDYSGTGAGPDPDHHSAFLSTGGLSRIVTNTVTGTIDCNWINPSPPNPPSVDPWCPANFRYPTARHGTGVAGIILGQADPFFPVHFPEGHASEAKLLSYAFTAQNPDVFGLWPTSASTVIQTVEALQLQMLMPPPLGSPCHVLSISYHLWPDPDHPTQLALDRLEREFDVMVVTLAGNEGDATILSPGFTNGLTVGNVHKFDYATGRYPNRVTSRGPLFGDYDRYFPDVSASGASSGTLIGLGPDPTSSPPGLQVLHIVMPLIDYQSPPSACLRYPPGMNINERNRMDYNAEGSSMAAPQVAGAAALYRAERVSASAQETRAAILLSTIDPFLQATMPDPHNTYVGRNSYGTGYVRDDLLAKYAKRQVQDNPLGQAVTLTPQVPTTVVPYGGLVPNDHYAVAITWPRPINDGTDPNAWANIDLEIRRSSGEIMARSDSLRNTHERLVFKAVGSTSVNVHVVGADLVGQSLSVFVAARRVSGDGAITSKRTIPGFVTSLPQESTCTALVQDQRVSQVLPSNWAGAYGNGPLQNPFSSTPRSDDPYSGLRLCDSSFARTVSVAYDATLLGLSPHRIRALALRTWKPLQGGTGTFTVAEIRMAAQPSSWPLTPIPIPHTNLGTVVAQNVQVQTHDPQWHARGSDTWPIIIPLDQPFDVAGGQHLAVWMQFALGSYAVDVDWVTDGDPRYSMIYNSGSAVVGLAPMLGLMSGEVTTGIPELHAYGYPTWGGTVLFQVRQAGGPGSLATIFIGLTNPSFYLAPCRVLTGIELGQLFTLLAAPMGHATAPFTIPAIDPTLIHKHLYLQALVQVGGAAGPVRYSNGLRLTIGGALP